MATLYEYFVRDARTLTNHQTLSLKKQASETLGEVIARLHFDFEAYAKYISFYIPDIPAFECPKAMVLNQIPTILKWPEQSAQIEMRFGEELTDGKDLVFTGQVYLYSERPVRDDLRARLIEEAKRQGHRLTFRSTKYKEERNKWERPLAFISHDNRDQKEIAEPIAIELQKGMCPVWFDKYSLKVGDSLREKIEEGLKECPKCILILTPNFLSNEGWTSREYQSVFTRELVENKKVILPVWHNVTREDVYKYSPILADRVAAQWTDGVEEVARKLIAAINAPI